MKVDLLYLKFFLTIKDFHYDCLLFQTRGVIMLGHYILNLIHNYMIVKVFLFMEAKIQALLDALIF